MVIELPGNGTIPAAYEGREQTYIKHIILESYLERLAYNILSFMDLVYVDGFCGPWQSAGENKEDTSFHIAISTLEKVRENARKRKGRENAQIYYVFVEKKKESFETLKDAVEKMGEVNGRVHLINDEFCNSITEINQYVGKRFGLYFIDPTGWKGYPLQAIAPLFQNKKCEVIINFMYNHIKRFIGDNREGINNSFNLLFGGSEWQQEMPDYPSEKEVVTYYQNKLKGIGKFTLSTHTRILKSNRDESHYYLIYATKKFKGVQEFRGIEKKALTIQKEVRGRSKAHHEMQKRQEKWQMDDLFAHEPIVHSQAFDFDSFAYADEYTVESKILEILAEKEKVIYDKLAEAILEEFSYTEPDLKACLKNLHQDDKIRVELSDESRRAIAYGKGDFILRSEKNEIPVFYA